MRRNFIALQNGQRQTAAVVRVNVILIPNGENREIGFEYAISPINYTGIQRR